MLPKDAPNPMTPQINKPTLVINGATRAWSTEPDQKGCFSKNLATRAETEALSAHHLWIEPGGGFKPHVHESETELHFIISGIGQVLIGERWAEVVAGDAVLAFPGIVHGLRNSGSDPLFVLCVFSPPLV
jgi:mannose-6-phosphate isomerase-like protein (cupin superfamily)